MSGFAINHLVRTLTTGRGTIKIFKSREFTNPDVFNILSVYNIPYIYTLTHLARLWCLDCYILGKGSDDHRHQYQQCKKFPIHDYTVFSVPKIKFILPLLL